jgi:hypothetical protein
MKTSLLKLALVMSIVTATSFLAKAQKFGDNLGNHKATKDLQMEGKTIFNAAGVAIGTTTLANGSVALQIGSTTQAILLSSVAANTDIVAPLNGMIVYNTTDNKFYLYQNGAWVTFALGLKTATDINTTSTPNAYTLTQEGQETVLKLSPADATNPGIVTAIGSQIFGGDKAFNGNVELNGTSTLTVGTGATTLGGTLAAAGDVTVGTATTAANTVLNGNFSVVGGNTILTGSTGAVGSEVSAITINNAIVASATDEQNYLILDATGKVKKGTFSGTSLAKYMVPVPTGASANFDTESNSGIQVVLTVTGIKVNDAIVVNFASADVARFAGLTILSATATADNTVTVNIADFRNPAPTTGSYAVPSIDGANLIVTKYNAVNTSI